MGLLLCEARVAWEADEKDRPQSDLGSAIVFGHKDHHEVEEARVAARALSTARWARSSTS